MLRVASWLVAVALCALAGPLIACTPSTPAQATTPAAASSSATGVRSVAWPSLTYPHLDLLADDELSAPQYFDLTGDGVEDAALEGLAITPGGNSYTTYVFVFTQRPGDPEPVLLATLIGGDRADGALRITAVDAAGLHVARAIRGPGDAMCCPSTEQHELWMWNGSQFVEDPTRRHVAPTEQ